MDRREAIKGIAAAGGVAVMPSFISANSNTLLPSHFIGLGGAGCNALEVIYEQRQKGYFTCITDPARPNLAEAIQFLSYKPPVVTGSDAMEYLLKDDYVLQPTDEMQMLLSQQHHYVLLAGLGGYTGTRLLQAFTQYLFKEKQSFSIVASLPFTWETGRRKPVEQLLPNFQALHQFHSFDLNQLAGEKENKKMKMNLFFQMANEQFYRLFLQHQPHPY